MTGVVIIY